MTYSTVGSYTVRLRVTDARGASSVSTPIVISAGAPPNTAPTARITAPPAETAWRVGDVIAFSGALSHLYVPAGDSATLTVLGVGARGDLVVLGTFPTAPEAHCVTADDAGNAYVCDPGKGRLLVFRDPYPASR